MTLIIFYIKLHRENATFFPGESISGEVIVELNRTKSFRGLKLEFKGKANVEWSEEKHDHHHRHHHHHHHHGNERTHLHETRTKTEYFSASEKYFDREIYILGSSSGKVELPPGHHVFPFNYNLPRNIPSTFDHGPGRIDYSIRAVFNRPWKFDHDTKKDFFVISPIDLTQYRATPIDDVIEATYCNCLCPCISQGSMQAEIHFPTNAYTSGDAIEVMIHLNTYSQSIRIKKVELKLEQVMEFFAHLPHHKSKQLNTILSETKERGPFPSNRCIQLGIRVPFVNYLSLPHCAIINVKYLVHVIITPSGCHCSSQRKYDILLGSKRLADPAMSQTYNIGFTPTAPMTSPPYPVASSNVPMPFPVKVDFFSENPTNSSYQHGSVSQYPSASNCPCPPSAPPVEGSNRPDITQLQPPSYDDAMKNNKN